MKPPLEVKLASIRDRLHYLAKAHPARTFFSEAVQNLDLMQEILRRGSVHPRSSRTERRKIARTFCRLLDGERKFLEHEAVAELVEVAEDFIEDAV